MATSLTLPASSWIFSVTVIVSEPVAGSGGGGSMLQLNDGPERTGPDVVWAFGVPATAHVQSYAVMVPGALDELASNVQSSAVPPLMTAHVSVTWRPLTPKFAVATTGRVNAIVAVADAPPYEAWIVADVGTLTTCVNTVKLTLESPEITVTSAGTTAMPSLESVTATPPFGAGPFNVTVAVTFDPPTTVDGLTVIDASRRPADTLSADDCRLLPFIVAVIVTVPDATPQTVNDPDVAPAGMSTDEDTVAMAGLLLDSPTVTPPLPAAVASVTVP